MDGNGGADDASQGVCSATRNLFQDNLSVMYIVDRTTGRILEANASAERFYGYPRAQLLGMTIHQINAPQASGRRSLLPESMYYRQNHYRYRHRLADGDTREVEIYASPVRSLGNRVYLSIVHDVTERAIVEDQLLVANEDMSRLMRAIAALLVVVDGENRILKWNASASNLIGIPEADALGHTLQELDIQWNFGKLSETLALCRKNRQPVSLERVPFAPKGQQGKTLKINIFPLPEDAGSQIGLLMLGEDVTEREFLQSQLAQAQKLQSIGQLAAGIAHEINTPAQYVGNNLFFLVDAFSNISALCVGFRRLLAAARAGQPSQELVAALEKDMADRELDYLEEEAPRALAQAKEGIARISTIVQSMKQFAHPGSAQMAEADINEAMHSTAMVSRNEWKYVAQLEEEYDPALPNVVCMISEINQVVLNLIINAAHAIADAIAADPQHKGRIGLGTRSSGGWVEISVSDNGTGIPEAARARVFDPFFTTKEVGRGTGQGLAIARSIVVEKHKGQLFFDTELGQGTTFIIRLPLRAPEG